MPKLCLQKRALACRFRWQNKRGSHMQRYFAYLRKEKRWGLSCVEGVKIHMSGKATIHPRRQSDGVKALHFE
jgi:hypothetical protein